jgi:hypothetical protein
MALLITAVPSQVAHASGHGPATGGKSSARMGTQAVWPWINYNSDKCLGVPGGNMANGTGVVPWACDGSLDQYWLEMPLSDGNFYEMRNAKDSSKCLGVPGGDVNPGTQLVIWTCNGSLDQRWAAFELVDEPCFVLLNLNSGLVMGVANGQTDNGAPVIQWYFDHSADQHWC